MLKRYLEYDPMTNPGRLHNLILASSLPPMKAHAGSGPYYPAAKDVFPRTTALVIIPSCVSKDVGGASGIFFDVRLVY